MHLGSYGRDLAPPSSLLDLLRALDGAPGDVTFRISSLEPMDCSPEIVDLVARSGRFAPHFHLPLQHGSDRVLAAMRRPVHRSAFYRGLVGRHPRAAAARVDRHRRDRRVSRARPEADAEAREGIVAALPLSYLHVFPYSDRPGTAAAAMTPKVAPADDEAAAAAPHARHRRATARRASSASQVGTVRPGLTLDDGTTVLTDNFLKVRIPPGLARNMRVRVRIDADAPVLAGHVVSR